MILYKFRASPVIPDALEEVNDVLDENEIRSLIKYKFYLRDQTFFSYSHLECQRYLQDIIRYKKFIKEKKFHFSRFYDLNDPKEGVYRNPKDKHKDISFKILQKIYSEKNNKYICCFSKSNAKKYILMWSHYANGFKGYRIGIEIDKDIKESFKDVKYLSEKEFYKYDSTPSVDEILIRKRRNWNYEYEKRIIVSQEDINLKIGTIKEITFSCPYADYYSPLLERYYKTKDALGKYAKQYDIKVSEIKTSDISYLFKKYD